MSRNTNTDSHLFSNQKRLDAEQQVVIEACLSIGMERNKEKNIQKTNQSNDRNVSLIQKPSKIKIAQTNLN